MPPVLRKATVPLPRSVICGSSLEMVAVERDVFLLLKLVSTTRSPLAVSRNSRLMHLPYWLHRAGLSLGHQNSGESHL